MITVVSVSKWSASGQSVLSQWSAVGQSLTWEVEGKDSEQVVSSSYLCRVGPAVRSSRQNSKWQGPNCVIANDLEWLSVDIAKV